MVLADSELEWDLHDVEIVANRPYGVNSVRVNTMTEGGKICLLVVEHESYLCLGSFYGNLLPEVCYERLVNSANFNSSQHSKSLPKRAGRTMKMVKANTRHSFIISEHLACKMNIGLEKAKHIMRETT